MSQQLAQRFLIDPEGAMLGGTLSYQIDPNSGLLTYNVDCKVRVLFFPISYQKSGTAKIDPAKILSSAVQPGEHIQMGLFQLKVEQINAAKKATCNVQVIGDGIQESGIAILDLTQPYLRIESLHTEGTIKGHSIPLSLKEI